MQPGVFKEHLWFVQSPSVNSSYITTSYSNQSDYISIVYSNGHKSAFQKSRSRFKCITNEQACGDMVRKKRQEKGTRL